ncbi:hypothetical protein K1I94_05350 [Streptococcus sanguinis]|uniref:hypothetical protein n=1 Tax=Streptococcus sanguinis TaxID=1305 RepID=UPI001CC19B48|nr:hypothetical protein [Streptococcus sanguinis]MBZ2066317.1 hypothetical protein [Streptococcus sanguinis]
MKKARLTSIFMLSLLIVSNLVLPARVFAEEANANNTGKEILSSLFAIEESLNEKGLSLKQFAQLQQRGEGFYSKLAALAGEMSTKQPQLTEEQKKIVDEKLEKARKISDKWDYASQMAQQNMQRDGNARDINKETVYMYLSHYIDIKTGILDTVNPYISNDGYFSAWIVNDDRRAYDQYLSKALPVEQVATGVKMIKSIIDVKNLFKEPGKILSINNYTLQILYSLILLRSIPKDLQGLDDNIKEFVTALNVSNDPKMTIGALEQSLELEGYDDVVKGAVKGMVVNVIALLAGLKPSIVMDLIESGIEFLGYASKDLYDKALWISLIQYNNMRVSKRIMRYYGFDF